MPSRVLVHLPPPAPPQLVDRPPRRPTRGEEFPTGWTVADYQLERGEFEGGEYPSELWVVAFAPEDDRARYPRRRADPLWLRAHIRRRRTPRRGAERRRHPH